MQENNEEQSLGCLRLTDGACYNSSSVAGLHLTGNVL